MSETEKSYFDLFPLEQHRKEVTGQDHSEWIVLMPMIPDPKGLAVFDDP